MWGLLFRAALAQLVEHLTCNHEVSGSIPGGGCKGGINFRGVSRAVKWGRL